MSPIFPLLAALASAATFDTYLPDAVVPGATANVTVQVLDQGEPLQGEAVRLTGADGLLDEARTDDEGWASMSVDVPGFAVIGTHQWSLEAAGSTVTYDIDVGPDVQLLLTGDRTLYRPGHTVHLRALALDRITRQAVSDEPVRFKVTDDRFNTVLDETLATDAFGVATVVLPLSEDAMEGTWSLAASAGKNHFRREFRVESYTLPRFTTTVGTGSTYLGPDDQVEAELSVAYRQGMGVAGARITATASTIASHPEAGFSKNAFARVEVTADVDGRGRIALDLPDYLTDSELDEDSAVLLDIEVVDPSGHRETLQHRWRLLERAAELDVQLQHDPVWGQPTRMLVRTTADGTPVDSEVRIVDTLGAEVTASTGPDGIARIDVPWLWGPDEAVVTATAGDEVSERRIPSFEQRYGIAVVVDEPAVFAGEPVAFEVRTTEAEPVTVLLEGPSGIVAQAEVAVSDHVARGSLPTPAGHAGVYQLRARQGGTHKSTHRVWLRTDDDMNVTIGLPETQLPGADTEVTVDVKRAGQPVRASVELAALDQGIYALDGAGLTGLEDRFGEVWGRHLKDAPLPIAGESNASLQDRTAFWLGPAQEHWAMAVRTTPINAPPEFVQRLAHELAKLPALRGRSFDRAVPWLVLAWVGLLGVAWWRRDRDIRRLEAGTITALNVALLVGLLLLPRANAPTTAPLPGDAADNLADSELRSLLKPRAYPGLGRPLDPGLLDLGSERIPPDAGVVIRVDHDGVWVFDEWVLPIVDGAVETEQKRGQMISPLYDHLIEQAETHKDLGARYSGWSAEPPKVDVLDREEDWQDEMVDEPGWDRDFRGVVTLLFPRDMPFSTVREVMYTAGQAQFGNFAFVLTDEVRPVVPRSLEPTTYGFAFGSVLLALLVGLGIARRRNPLGFVAWLSTAWLALWMAATRWYPWHRDLAFPLEDAAYPLWWLTAALVAGAAVLDLTRREPISGPVLGLGMLVALMSQPLDLDHRGYIDITRHRESSLPAIGAPTASMEDNDDSGAKQLADLDGPRIRRWFPDTLHYDPQLAIDEAATSVPVVLGDQLTTWKWTALASTTDGAVSLGRADLVATQPIQVEASLPPQLSVGDVLYVPVSVYNHTDSARTLTVQAPSTEHVRALDDEAHELTLTPFSAGRVTLPLRMERAGETVVRFFATGQPDGDAIELPITVVPRNSLPVSSAAHGSFAEGLQVERPAGMLPETTEVRITAYRDPIAQSSHTLRSMLAQPYGCAEQTTSSTLPNVVLLSVLRDLGGYPELAEQARANSLTGLQRLLGYELEGGGFSFYGKGDPIPWLSGYALELLVRIEAELGAGGEAVERTATYVARRIDNGPKADRTGLLFTAARALSVRDLPDVKQQAERGFAEMLPDVLAGDSARDVALLAGAAAHLDVPEADVQRLMQRLDELADAGAGGTRSWTDERGSRLFGSWSRRTEVTALATLAVLEHGGDATPSGSWLQQHRRADGRWHSSRDTARAWEALLGWQQTLGSRDLPDTVLVNGQPVPLIDVRPGVREAVLRDPGTGVLDVTANSGLGAVSVKGRAPWRAVASRPSAGSLAVSIVQTPTRPHIGDTVTATITLSNRGEEVAMPMAHFRIPPGLDLPNDTVQRLSEQWEVERAERQGQELVLYLNDLREQGRHTIDIDLLAVGRVDGEAPGVYAYDYYAAENFAFSEPSRIAVHDPAAPPAVDAAVVTSLPYEPQRLVRRYRYRRWAFPKSRRNDADANDAREALRRDVVQASQLLRMLVTRGETTGGFAEDLWADSGGLGDLDAAIVGGNRSGDDGDAQANAAATPPRVQREPAIERTELGLVRGTTEAAEQPITASDFKACDPGREVTYTVSWTVRDRAPTGTTIAEPIDEGTKQCLLDAVDQQRWYGDVVGRMTWTVRWRAVTGE